MQLQLQRIIFFTSNMGAMAAFYRDLIGLEVRNEEDGWIEFSAGACNIALHHGKASAATRSPKIVFHANDVAAARTMLVARGVTSLGKVNSARTFDLCDGKDPDGNAFQISSRN